MLKAKDLFRGEDFDLGIGVLEATEPAVETILASDCLIFFGRASPRPQVRSAPL